VEAATGDCEIEKMVTQGSWRQRTSVTQGRVKVEKGRREELVGFTYCFLLPFVGSGLGTG
jgi:hypothetical protein